MTYFHFPSRWHRQPTGQIELNRGHWLADGLGIAFLGIGASGYDPISKPAQSGTLTNPPRPRPLTGEYGHGFPTGPGADECLRPTIMPANPSTAVTVVAAGYCGSAASEELLLSQQKFSSSTGGTNFGITSSGVRFEYSTAGSFKNAAGGSPKNKFGYWAARYDGVTSGATVYFDGASVGTNATTGTIDTASSGEIALLRHQRGSNTLFWWSGRAAFCYYWPNRLLDEWIVLRELRRAPYQFWRPITRRIYLPAAAGGATDILATTGNETWNGLTAGIKVNTNVSATTGIETWNGLGASINARVSITAGTGVETWNGLAANIAAASGIMATTGVETWNGLAASVSLGGALQIQALTGTELWGGNSATVSAGGVVTGHKTNRVFRPKGKRVIYQ